MRRRRVSISFEVDCVLTVGELKKAMRINFPGGRFVDICGELEKDCNGSMGTIEQVQVNAFRPKGKRKK